MVIEKVAAIDRRYEELNQMMADRALVTDHDRLAELAREQSDLEPVVTEYLAWLDAHLAD